MSEYFAGCGLMRSDLYTQKARDDILEVPEGFVNVMVQQDSHASMRAARNLKK